MIKIRLSSHQIILMTTFTMIVVLQLFVILYTSSSSWPSSIFSAPPLIYLCPCPLARVLLARQAPSFARHSAQMGVGVSRRQTRRGQLQERSLEDRKPSQNLPHLPHLSKSSCSGPVLSTCLPCTNPGILMQSLLIRIARIHDTQPAQAKCRMVLGQVV